MKSKLFIIATFIFTQLQAQEWVKKNRIDIRDVITAFSYDDQENIYLATARAEVVRYDHTGSETLRFSWPNSGFFNLIEARNNLNTFCFSRDNQSFIYLDRFLANPNNYLVSEFSEAYSWLVAPALDQNFWLLQHSPPSLLKIDRRFRTLIQEVQLPFDFELEDAVFFKAQKGALLLVDRVKGVYVFDLFGNPLASLSMAGAEYAHISDNTIIAYSNGLLHMRSVESESVITIEAPQGYRATIRMADRYYFISNNHVDVFQYVNP